MKPILFLGIIGLVSVSAYGQSSSKKEDSPPKLHELPTGIGRHKVMPFVRAAVALQKMGKEKACEHLKKFAEIDNEPRVHILCRTLFSPKKDKLFRTPGFGKLSFMGGTTIEDWPLRPIELVDDVPFVIVKGYMIAGRPPEKPLAYLNYCIENCDWSTTQFDKVDDKIVEKAFEKLLTSKKWKNSLTDYEREVLTSQIK